MEEYMDIKWLKTFIVAAKYENFRKTSEELFLTQPAITKHIKRLEENLSIQLFDRIGNKVTLTSAGHHFLPFAKDMIEKYEEGLDDFESWKQGYKRKLIIATAPQIASSFLPSLLESVILVGPKECKDIYTFDEKTILQNYRLITHNHPDYWDNLLNNLKRFYPTIRTMKVNQVEVTKRFIEEGLGVSYLPYTAIKDEIARNKLAEIKPDKIIVPTSSTYVLTKVETTEVSIFTKFLKSIMNEC